MSRSNGNNGQSPPPPRGPAPHWQHHPEQDPQWPGEPPRQHGQGAHGHAAHNQAPHHHASHNQGAPPIPTAPHWAPYQQPHAPAPVTAPHPPARGAHGDPHAAYPPPPPPAHDDGRGWAQQEQQAARQPYPAPPELPTGRGQPHGAYAEPAPPAPQPAHRPSLASYVPHHERPPAEPAGYDLAQYGRQRAASPPQPAEWDLRREPDFQQDPHQYAAAERGQSAQYSIPPHVPPQQWSSPTADRYAPQPAQQDQYGYAGQNQYGQPALEAPYGQQPHDPHQGYDQGYSHDGQQHANPADPQYQEEYAEDEEPVEEEPKKRRGLLLIAALVSAIVAGGGMAYLYKTFSGSGSGKAPVLKAEQTPPKARPQNPGGKEFPFAERKITERVGEAQAPAEGQSTQVASAENAEPAGPRRVQIIPITPNGAVASGPPPESAPRPTIAVPGMVIDNSSMAPRPAPIPQAAPAPQPQRQAAVQPPPQAPAPPRAAPPPPQPRPQPSAEATPAAPAAPERRASVAVPKVPKNNDAFSPGAQTQGAAPATGGNGFVAVLASQKSRMDALKVFADLQQRYGDVLSNKPADVQEANLGERGVFYRAVVGPPGSRESAAQVCTQLKAAGFNGCWVTAY